MRRLIVSLMCGLWAAPALAQCPADLATYSMADAERFSINFAKQKQPKTWSNIQATLNTPTRHFDFEFAASNGYSLNYLVILTKGVKIKRDLPIMLSRLKPQSLGPSRKWGSSAAISTSFRIGALALSDDTYPHWRRKRHVRPGYR